MDKRKNKYQRMKLKKSYLVLLFITQLAVAQEGIPIYSDYLSDNYFLLHPSMAGIAGCTKLRRSEERRVGKEC